MISLCATPLTDLPAHRFIRSYFTRDANDGLGQDASELSHLWSNERRHEEDKFETLMTELATIAEELDVDTSGPYGSEYSSIEAPAVDHFVSCGCENDHIYSSFEQRTAFPSLLCAYNDFCADLQADEWLKSQEEEREERWLNDMNGKVQILLREAHQVLGTTSTAFPIAGDNDDLSFLGSGGGEEADSSATDEGGTSLDVISLYMPDESSFASEGPTLLEDIQETCCGHFDARIVSLKSDGDDWLLDDDTSTDTANTSLSLEAEQYLSKEGSQNLLKEDADSETLADRCKPIEDLNRKDAHQVASFSQLLQTPPLVPITVAII